MDAHFTELNIDELSEIDGGGALTVIGGGLIVAGAILSGGGALVVGVGVVGGLLTAASGL